MEIRDLHCYEWRLLSRYKNWNIFNGIKTDNRSIDPQIEWQIIALRKFTINEIIRVGLRFFEKDAQLFLVTTGPKIISFERAIKILTKNITTQIKEFEKFWRDCKTQFSRRKLLLSYLGLPAPTICFKSSKEVRIISLFEIDWVNLVQVQGVCYYETKFNNGEFLKISTEQI